MNVARISIAPGISIPALIAATGVDPDPLTNGVVYDLDSGVLTLPGVLQETAEVALAVYAPSVPTVTELALQIRQHLDTASQAEMNAIAADYPDYEIRTWPDQEREARAWVTNSTAPTPTLGPIATERGLTLAELCARVIAKADIYRSAVARCVGLRRRLEDEVFAAESAGDRAALEAISWPGLGS